MKNKQVFTQVQGCHCQLTLALRITYFKQLITDGIYVSLPTEIDSNTVRPSKPLFITEDFSYSQELSLQKNEIVPNLGYPTGTSAAFDRLLL